MFHIGRMTPLAAYMKLAKLTDAALAERVGRDRSTITKIRRGQTRPSLDLAVKIAALSDGMVSPDGFPRPKQRQMA